VRGAVPGSRPEGWRGGAPDTYLVRVMVAPALHHHVSIGSKVGAYVALTKPRIIELLLVTTVPTMVVAEQGMPPLWLMVATVIGGALAAGGANAINMYVDRDIDALMNRTKGRPLVTGAVTPRSALVFAITIEALAFLWLWTVVNPLSAVLGLSACLFYVFVYTLWLKRSSSQNIVVGGAAGAIPVLIGWSSVTDSVSATFGWAPVTLFALMFFWTPPHFWALAIKYKDDYAAADVPMLPVVATYRETTRKMLAYTIVVVALSLAFGWAAELGALYWAAAVVLGGVFIWMSVRVMRTESPAMAIKLFTFSITYITLLFGAMAADVLLRQGW
jgi:protoheme IX farnesyltransferase